MTSESTRGHWFVRRDGRRYATPIFLCLAAIVFADIAFAIDSIPAAFAITRDPLMIWMGNVFALLGMRALFVLVESLVARFRYLDETIAIVLGLVGVKLLVEDLVKVGPVGSFAIIAVAFTIGIVLSIVADRRDPDAEEKRRERAEACARAASSSTSSARRGALGRSAVVRRAPAEQPGESEQPGAGDHVDRRQQAWAEAAAHQGDQPGERGEGGHRPERHAASSSTAALGERRRRRATRSRRRRRSPPRWRSSAGSTPWRPRTWRTPAAGWRPRPAARRPA